MLTVCDIVRRTEPHTSFSALILIPAHLQALVNCHLKLVGRTWIVLYGQMWLIDRSLSQSDNFNFPNERLELEPTYGLLAISFSQ
jgi:hypothetical protein